MLQWSSVTEHFKNIPICICNHMGSSYIYKNIPQGISQEKAFKNQML